MNTSYDKGFHLPEWAKNLLIVLLSLSALYLFTLSPLYLNSPLKGWSDGLFVPKEDPSQVSVSLTAAARPVRIAVNNSAGRFGLQYDADAVNALFDQTGSLLGEALGSAGEPQSIPEYRWRQALTSEGIYFDFSGAIPFSALTGWFQDGQSNDRLTGDVRRLALAPGEDGQVWLYYQDAWTPGSFSACATALSAQSHLSPVAALFTPNGAKFAFEDPSLDRCYPYTLVTDEPGSAPVYAASSPLTVSGTEALDSVLSSLSFSGALVTSYVADNGTVYRSGEDTLLAARDGSLSYHSAAGELYPVASEGSSPTLAEMIEATRRILIAAAEPLCEDARLYLISARQSGEETVITYGYSLGGAQVWTGTEGWCAQFRLTGSVLTGFTIHLRTYTATENATPMPPVRQAAAAMDAKGAAGSELLLVYLDTGGDSVSAGWVAS